MNTFLSPIENPETLMLKMIYGKSRRRFGKILMPLKVFVARMPLGFGVFYGRISKLDKKLDLPLEIQMLIRERVARLNVCSFCVDIGRWLSIKAHLNQTKFEVLDEYATNPLFSEAERAALDYVGEITQKKQVAPPTIDRLKEHFSERAICEIVWLVASEHFYNMTNIALNIHSDMLCQISGNQTQP
jgi:alkylhydroperoxidase family enzyme